MQRARMIDELKRFKSASVERSAGLELQRFGTQNQKAGAGGRSCYLPRRTRALQELELQPHARPAAWVGRPERQRQDNAAAHDRRTDCLRMPVRIQRADALRIVYFDQHRDELDVAQSLQSSALPSRRFCHLSRSRPMHVVSWAKRSSSGMSSWTLAVGRLSGGERARVAIAKPNACSPPISCCWTSRRTIWISDTRSSRKQPSGFSRSDSCLSRMTATCSIE